MEENTIIIILLGVQLIIIFCQFWVLCAKPLFHQWKTSVVYWRSTLCQGCARWFRHMRNNIFTPHRTTAKVNQVIFRYAIFGNILLFFISHVSWVYMGFSCWTLWSKHLASFALNQKSWRWLPDRICQH